MRPLRLWLFNDKIVYGLFPKWESFQGITYKEVLTTECIIETDDIEDESCFAFLSPQDSFFINTNSTLERDDWLQAFSNVIEKKDGSHNNNKRNALQRKRSSGSGSMKPLWKLDEASTCCDICFNQFTVTDRRHHCR